MNSFMSGITFPTSTRQQFDFASSFDGREIGVFDLTQSC